MPQQASHRVKKRVLVTGATSGLGKAVCHQLLTGGHGIVMGVRRPAAAASLIERWGAEGRATVVELDLSSLASVRKGLDQLEDIDSVICNAGLQVPSGLKTTADGHELTFGVNHLGHFQLVSGLIPKMRQGGRIVFLSSRTHDPRDRVAKIFGFRGGIYASAAELAAGTPASDAKGRQIGLDRYATSKLCNIVSMYALAQRFDAEQIGFFCVDPGLVPATGLAREHPMPVRLVYRLAAPLIELMPFASTPRRSAAVMADVATDNALAGMTARHFDHRGIQTEPWDRARNQSVIDDLYAWSSAAIGL